MDKFSQKPHEVDIIVHYFIGQAMDTWRSMFSWMLSVLLCLSVYFWWELRKSSSHNKPNQKIFMLWRFYYAPKWKLSKVSGYTMWLRSLLCKSHFRSGCWKRSMTLCHRPQSLDCVWSKNSINSRGFHQNSTALLF